MHLTVKRTMVTLALTALAATIATPAWAAAGSTDRLKIMPVNAPVQISAGAGWRGHWAEQDLIALRSSFSLKPVAVVSGAVDPNEAMETAMLADVLLHIFGAGGEHGDVLSRAITLGLIRPSDFDGDSVDAHQPLAREMFALFLTRALGMKGAEDPSPPTMAPKFVDADLIGAKYKAAVALMQAEGLLIGDDQGRFSPSQPVTFAQAARTLVKVSAWSQQRGAKIAGFRAADATYLINGQKVTLTNGTAQQPAAPGSASMAVTKLQDPQAVGDLNGDGRLDVAVVVTYSGGGTGTFYYLSVLQNDGTLTKAVMLGDRIALQNVRVVAGKVAVDLLTRGASDPMATAPYLKETRMFEMKDGALVPVAQ